MSTPTAVRPDAQTAPVPARAAAPPPSDRRALRAVLHEGWREQRRSALVWGLSLGLYGAFIAAIYPSIQDTLASLADSYPASLKAAFGVGAMTTVESYVNTEMFSIIVPLLLAFFVARSVAAPLVGAEEHGRLDTVLSLPLSRRALVGGTFAVTAALCLVVLAITGALVFASGRIAGTGISLGLTAAGVVGLWPLAVLAAGVGVLASGVFHRAASVMGTTMGVLVAMYALDLAGRLADALEPLRWLSAFRYYGSPMVDGIDVAAFAGLTAVGVLLAAAGALLFERRDIRH